MKSGRIFLNGGGKTVTLKSGDEGMLVKVSLDHLRKILKDHPIMKRTWENSVGVTSTETVFCVMPRKEARGTFTHYIEMVPPTGEYIQDNEEDDTINW